MLHIHLGPSPLALGLLIPCTLSSGFEVSIISRPGDNGLAEFERSGTGPRGRLSIFTVSGNYGPGRFVDLPQSLREKIASSPVLLITSTLRDAVEVRESFIHELLRERRGKGETVLIVCENDPQPQYERIADECRRNGGTVLDTVVNRLCTPAGSVSGRRVTLAHPVGEWVIEQPDTGSQVLEALGDHDDVVITDQIDAWRDRKIWIVNGTHQALALFAAAHNVVGLPLDGVDLSAEIEKVTTLGSLAYLQSAINQALLARHPELGDNLGFSRDHLVAFHEHPDTASRVLSGFRRSNLLPFMHQLGDRLMKPAAVCREIGHSVEPFEWVVENLESVSRNVDHFADAADIRRGTVDIDPERDQEVVKTYRRMLSDWLPEEDAQRRARRLERHLADQAEAFAA